MKLDKRRLGQLSAKSFAPFPSLVSLSLSKCDVTLVSAGTFVPLMSLRALDLSHNRVPNTFALRPLSLNTALRHLRLEHNPIAWHKNYRPTIIHTLPALHSLDGNQLPRAFAYQREQARRAKQAEEERLYRAKFKPRRRGAAPRIDTNAPTATSRHGGGSGAVGRDQSQEEYPPWSARTSPSSDGGYGAQSFRSFGDETLNIPAGLLSAARSRTALRANARATRPTPSATPRPSSGPTRTRRTRRGACRSCAPRTTTAPSPSRPRALPPRPRARA